MTSREHARRLMLILLSSAGGTTPDAGSETDRPAEHHDDRQAGEGRDDSREGDDRGEKRLLEALMLS
jgi:hypothetical protein